MGMQSGSQNRRYKGLIRCFEETAEEIKKAALAEGVTMAELLQTAWEFYVRNKAMKPCRNCGVAMEASRLMGPNHLQTCPLYRSTASAPESRPA